MEFEFSSTRYKYLIWVISLIGIIFSLRYFYVVNTNGILTSNIEYYGVLISLIVKFCIVILLLFGGGPLKIILCIVGGVAVGGACFGILSLLLLTMLGEPDLTLGKFIKYMLTLGEGLLLFLCAYNTKNIHPNS
ncbi:MAG: hypothetical protein ACI93R_003948 [Flavobacteriales bacterium]|jgi:hypothetical protein